MSKPITKIEITSFRGATSHFKLEFNKNKDLTMLFGENGSGKSSILDAIDVVVNGGVGALEDISVGRNPTQYLCTLGNPTTMLRARVYSDTETWTATMQGSSISINGPTIRPNLKILRRSRVLKLILARPKERYEALKHFIDIGSVEQSENNLSKKLRSIGKDIDNLLKDKSRQKEQLDQVWESEKRPGAGQTAMEWAKGKVDAGISELNTHLENLKKVVNAIKYSTDAKTDYSSKSTTMSSLQIQMAEIEKKIQDSPDFNADTTIKLVESLVKVKAYIQAETDLDKCPTCLRPMEREQLLSIVDEQLIQVEKLKSLNDQKQGIRIKLNTAKNNFSEAQNTFLEAVKTLQKNVEEQEITEITALNIDWPDLAEEEQDFTCLKTIVEQMETVKIGIEESRDQAQRDVSQFTSIKQWYEGIAKTDKEIIDKDRIRGGLKQALEIVHAKRVIFIQDILDNIADEANRLFQVIHPGENISLKKLKMEEMQTGSVNQTGDFYGNTDILPQAVFSESHLDTLGFCVWLALAKREEPEETVLLIDDIFSSADSTHLSRIVDLLAAESPNFLQVIVATHFRLWWARCRNARGIERVHLGGWSLVNGIRSQDAPLATKHLRDLVNDPILDRQGVSSKAGILLESVLDGLALIYRRPLPRNDDNRYTLGDLMDACGNLFFKYNLKIQRNENWETDDQPEDWQPTKSGEEFSIIKNLEFIRNQVGCHFNISGTEIPDVEVREFGKATANLVDALVCPNCGRLAKYLTKDKNSRRCSCQKHAILMTPVLV